MQGRKIYQEKLFTSFQLSEYVPADNLYRKINELIDFQFLYRSTSKYYGREGQKSVDPVVFIKLMLVGYLENINSDRRIIEVSRLRMDILLFIGYDLGEELPWHSTLSRTRQLYGREVFTEVFRAILKQCMDRGMVSGRRQAVDGFFVKANASLDSMVEREILEDSARFARELDENAGEFSPRSVKIPKEKLRAHCARRPKNNSRNDTHCSPRDPDAKLSIKPGKAMALNYLGEVSVDTDSHVITHIQAFTSEKRDSQCLAEVLAKARTNLSIGGLDLAEVVADRGFSGGGALREIEAMGITGYIPNRPQFRLEREGFEYNELEDCFVCMNSKKLLPKWESGCNSMCYSSKKSDCQGCPLSAACSGYNPKDGRARVNVSKDRKYYILMHQRMQTKKAARMMRIRQSTVEPVIGSLVNYTGLKKLNTIGLGQANKCMTMAGAAYNLKKLAKYSRNWSPKAAALSKAIKKGSLGALQELVLPLLNCRHTSGFRRCLLPVPV